MDRTCPACSARLDQRATSCPHCGAHMAAASGTDQTTEAGTADEAVRNTAVAAHLSTFAGLIVPFGSVIGPLAVWLTRRDQDPFIDQAGREALNFGISIAIYGSLLLVAALLLVGIPLLIVGVVAWAGLAGGHQGQPGSALPVPADPAAGPLTRPSPAFTADCGRRHAGLAILPWPS
jgi:uncharacterized Tic20 family protein